MCVCVCVVKHAFSVVYTHTKTHKIHTYIRAYENTRTCTQGLKTGMYYLRTKPAANAIQFTVDKLKLAQKETAGGGGDGKVEEVNKSLEAMVCSLKNKDECLMCSG